MAATLYGGGSVLPMTGAPAAEALLERDGRVAAVGPLAELRPLAGRGAQEVDLRGATLLPGFVDTHPHVLHFGAFAWPLADLSDARGYAEILARLRAKADALPSGSWVMGTPVGEPHYFLRRSWRDLDEGELPDRHVLDRASDRHPILIQAWAPTTPNVCALNSAGLAALGLSRETPDRVSDVWIEKDPRGEPTGRLRGHVNNYYTNDPFMHALLAKLPLLQLEAVVPGTLAAMRQYNRMGVTAVYEGHAMGAAEIGVWRALREQGALTLRVLAAPDAESYGLPWSQPLSDAEFDAGLERAHAMVERGDPWFRCDGVTLSRGGPCEPGFLRTWKPHRGPYGAPTTGVTFVSEEKERRAIAFCAERGLRLNFIGAGDRDHDEFLAHAEAQERRTPGAARGWILQHVFFLDEAQARRYAALGMDVTTSVSFTWGCGAVLAERIGEAALADLIPLRRMLDAGLRVACGSDWGPKNVFEHLELATTHRVEGRAARNDGPAQRVTREQALAMWTREAAAVLGFEGCGTLAPGSHADLIAVDRDPLRCAEDELAATRVLRTVVGGRVVHDDGSL